MGGKGKTGHRQVLRLVCAAMGSTAHPGTTAVPSSAQHMLRSVAQGPCGGGLRGWLPGCRPVLWGIRFAGQDTR